MPHHTQANVPPCEVSGSTAPVPQNHLGSWYFTPRKCLRCGLLEEGGCTRGDDDVEVDWGPGGKPMWLVELEQAIHEEVSPGASGPRPRVRVEVLEGPGAPRALVFRDFLSVGSSDDAELRLEDDRLLKTHFVLHAEADEEEEEAGAAVPYHLQGVVDEELRFGRLLRRLIRGEPGGARVFLTRVAGPVSIDGRDVREGLSADDLRLMRYGKVLRSLTSGDVLTIPGYRLRVTW